MFSVGDKVVYGNMGVCSVTDICVPDMPGAARECYVLVPHYVANSKVYAPVENNPVVMRHLLTPDQAETLIDSLPQVPMFPLSGEKQAMYETFRGAIKSADCTLLARLIKTLHQKKQNTLEQKRVVPSAEKEFFDTAERMLYGEIAVAMGMALDEVPEYIGGRLAASGQTLREVAS
ncbi:CarD family transcriptional regulator [Ruminococcaceae bacterium OttesenSCG-928-A11]|nr:CarD family transcriptional regulator [Ruminococcaceae bacterium OttesenSCG-928-A11]